MKILVAPALCAAVLVSACATRAGSVAPVAVAAADYGTVSCERLQSDLTATQARVKSLSDRQNMAAAADAAGVFLALIPVGSLVGGSVEGDLAQAKGEEIAIQRNIQQRCVMTSSSGE